MMTYLLEILYEHALVIDFAMFVLIWVVQLIVYPVFRQIESGSFSTWHRSYCNKIGFFVLPLMVAQLIESASACFFVGAIFDWTKLSAVLCTWIATFFVSAPLHRKLAKYGKDQILIGRLVSTNWIRTFLWSGVFLVSFVNY